MDCFESLGAVRKKLEHAYHFPTAPYTVSSLELTKFYIDDSLMLALEINGSGSLSATRPRAV